MHYLSSMFSYKALLLELACVAIWLRNGLEQLDVIIHVQGFTESLQWQEKWKIENTSIYGSPISIKQFSTCKEMQLH